MGLAAATVAWISVGLSVGATIYTMTQMPDNKSNDSIAGTKVTKNGTQSPRNRVYGTAIVGCTYVYSNVLDRDQSYRLDVFSVGGVGAVRFHNVWIDDVKMFDEDKNDLTDPANASSGIYDASSMRPRYKKSDGFKMQWRSGQENQVAAKLAIDNSDGEWTVNHRGACVPHIVIFADYSTNQDYVFFSDRYNINALVTGAEVFDPRTGKVDGESSNTALATLDFLMNDYYGMGVTVDYINMESFKYGATFCEDNDLRINSAIDASAKFADILQDMLACCGGALAIVDGKITFLVEEKVLAPVYELDEDSILKNSLKVSPADSGSYYNVVSTTFKSEINRDNDDDFVIPQNAASDPRVMADGKIITKSLKMPYARDAYEAEDGVVQHCVKYMTNLVYNKAKFQMSCSFDIDLHEFSELRPWDVIGVSSEIYGFKNKLFRVQSMKVATDADRFNIATIHCIEYDHSVYEGTVEGTGSLPRPKPDDNVPAPKNVMFTLSSFVNTGYGLLAWEASCFTPSTTYDIEYKLSSASQWTRLTSAFRGTQFTLTDLKEARYDFRVRTYELFLGSSDWTTITNVNVRPAYVIPEVTGLKVETSTPNFKFTWDDMTNVEVDNIPSSDAPNSAGSTGKLADVFHQYSIQIVVNGVMKYATTTKESVFTLDLEKNKEMMGGQPSRVITFRISIEDRLGNSSLVTELVANNRQIGVAGDVDVTNANGSATVEWSPCFEPDFAGTEVHISTTKGFTPSASTLHATLGKESFYVFPFPDKTTRYMRIAHFDTMGRDGLQYSPEITLTYDGVESAKSVRLISDSQTFHVNKSGVAAPSLIIMSAFTQNVEGSVKWTTSPSVALATTSNPNERILKYASMGNHDNVKVTVTVDGVTDTMTICKVRDGHDGQDGQDGSDGQDGNTIYEQYRYGQVINPDASWTAWGADMRTSDIYRQTRRVINDVPQAAGRVHRIAGMDGSNGADGERLFVVYHKNPVNQRPMPPEGAGNTGGWTEDSDGANWMSQKLANTIDQPLTFWSFPIQMKGNDGADADYEIVGQMTEEAKDAAIAAADAKVEAAKVFAQSYADGVASEAEKAAIAAADAKANAAETKAKAYADGVVTEAEQAAIAEAERLAAEAEERAKAAAIAESKDYSDTQVDAVRDVIEQIDLRALALPEDTNLLNVSTWKVGTQGSQVGFNRNGRLEESAIVSGMSPFGADALWECRPYGDSSGDGGWVTSEFPIDTTKTYRFCVWFKVKDAKGAGAFYLGCSQSGSTANLDGTVNKNPYFVSGTYTSLGKVEADKWYLAVGVVHPHAYTGSDSGMAGIYDPVTGEKLYDGTEFKAVEGKATQAHRCYLYYTNNNTQRQWMVRPRVEALDGTEVSLEKMFSTAVAGAQSLHAVKEAAEAAAKAAEVEAKAYADGVATEAEQAATEAAQAAAQAAEVKAKAYADGEISKAEQAAITEAERLAAMAEANAKAASDPKGAAANAQSTAQAYAKAQAEAAELRAKQASDPKGSATKAQQAAIAAADAKVAAAKTAMEAYADGVANDAEQAAILAAQAKADAAEVRAKAYADGEVTKAEQAAIDEAERLAAEAKKNATLAAEESTGRWSRNYTVSATKFAEVLGVRGAPLPTKISGTAGNCRYLVTLTTLGTATQTEYAAWLAFNGATWTVSTIKASGTSSNHPVLFIQDNKPYIKTYHTKDYTVRCVVEDQYVSAASVISQSTKDYAQAQANAAETKAKAYADGIVTESEQAAIDAANAAVAAAETRAKAYADGVATEAEQAAITAADAKAKAAETRAKAYADGEVTKAEQAAIDEAERLAAQAEANAKAASDPKGSAATVKSQAEAYARAQAEAAKDGAISKAEAQTLAEMRKAQRRTLDPFMDNALVHWSGIAEGAPDSITDNWESYSKVSNPIGGQHGGKVLRATNTVNGYTTAVIPVDVTKKYKARLKVRQAVNPSSGTRTLYAGAVTLDKNYRNLTGGAGTHRYFVCSPVTLPSDGSWVTYEGYIQGAGNDTHNFRPNTAYIRLLLLMNYGNNAGGGVVEVDEFSFYEVTDKGDLVDLGFETTQGAQDKANTVKAAAEAYARAQAELAKTQAKAYADGEVTASEARAIAEAQKKADAAKAAAIAASTPREKFSFSAHYHSAVIPLIPYSNGAAGWGESEVMGTLTFRRGGTSASNRTERIDLAVKTAYNNTYASAVKTATDWNWRFCTFLYNGKKWLGLQAGANVQDARWEFSGTRTCSAQSPVGTYDTRVPFTFIAYRKDGDPSGGNGVLNAEVNNSLDYAVSVTPPKDGGGVQLPNINQGGIIKNLNADNITAGKIAAQYVHADVYNGTLVNATNIKAGMLDADHINTRTFTGENAIFDAEVYGGVLTGAVVRTGSTGARAEMREDGYKFAAYNAQNKPTFYVDANGNVVMNSGSISSDVLSEASRNSNIVTWIGTAGKGGNMQFTDNLALQNDVTYFPITNNYYTTGKNGTLNIQYCAANGYLFQDEKSAVGAAAPAQKTLPADAAPTIYFVDASNTTKGAVIRMTIKYTTQAANGTAASKSNPSGTQGWRKTYAHFHIDNVATRPNVAAGTNVKGYKLCINLGASSIKDKLKALKRVPDVITYSEVAEGGRYLPHSYKLVWSGAANSVTNSWGSGWYMVQGHDRGDWHDAGFIFVLDENHYGTAAPRSIFPAYSIYYEYRYDTKIFKSSSGNITRIFKLTGV
ncbi:TPA: fibronectin type III domain-containing protein [Vibrio parahaemolyticus]